MSNPLRPIDGIQDIDIAGSPAQPGLWRYLAPPWCEDTELVILDAPESAAVALYERERGYSPSATENPAHTVGLADAAFFAANPTVFSYIRRRIPGEFGPFEAQLAAHETATGLAFDLVSVTRLDDALFRPWLLRRAPCAHVSV